MGITRPLYTKGFWGRSLDELKRYTNIGRARPAHSFPLVQTDRQIDVKFAVVKKETITGPQGPYVLFSFDSPDTIDDCKILSDQQIGGFSDAKLQWRAAPPPIPSPGSPSPESRPEAGYAEFSGSISLELPDDKPDIVRSGFAAWRTKDRKPTIFGRTRWDIDPYTYLALRIKSDGRKYLINIQTDSIVATDIHQHRLFARRPGEWETVFINWDDFVRTNHGFVVKPQMGMLRQKVRSIGIGLTDRVPGPFHLCIERVWAAVGRERDEVDKSRIQESQLRNRQGQRVKWIEDGESLESLRAPEGRENSPYTL